MLGKDLLRTHSAGNYIRPDFVRTDDPALLDLAKDLLNIFENGAGQTRGSLDELAGSCVMRMKDVKLARGILKVIQDGCEYSGIADRDWRALRRSVFLASARALKNGALPADAHEVRAAVLKEIEPELPEIYADLPEKETLARSRKLFPKEVLERYNMYLVQSLMLFTERLELTFSAAENPQLLRSLFRYLRFFRLLAAARKTASGITLTVEGPASIFENTLKYGLQVASFFPIVCRLSDWKAACSVHMNGKTKRLLLGPEMHLVCHFHNFSSYQPEEIRLFAEYFRKNGSRWRIDDAPGFLQHGAELIFPDFAFGGADGRTLYLELFHRWHASHLEKRLEQCAAGMFEGLLLGVDRALLKQDGLLKERLEQDPYFQKCGFLFRDFPGMENVEKVLEKQSSVEGGLF